MLFRSDGWVKSTLGPAIVGAQVYVCTQPANIQNPPTPLVSIFSDPLGNSPITQPVITDGFGHYDFYVANGTYTVIIVNAGSVQASYSDQTFGYPAFAGVFPQDAPASLHEWLKSYTAATGVFTETQPAFSDISGVATLAQLPSGISSNVLDMASGVETAPSPLFSASPAIQSIAAAVTSYVLTQVVATIGKAQYIGTFPNGGSNALVNNYFAFSGFANAVNNILDPTDGQIIASTTTSVTILSAFAVNEIHSGTATPAQAITAVTISSTPQFANNGAGGSVAVITGASNAANNGTWVVCGSNATLLNINNANGVLQSSPAGIATVEDDLTGTNINPSIYIQDSNGYWHGQAGVDVTTPSYVSGDSGTFTFGRRIYIRDNNLPYQEQDPNGNEYGESATNSLISVNHIAGRGVDGVGHQDRAIWVNMTNDQNNSAPFSGMECLQMEMDIVGSINFVNGGTNNEISVLSVQMSDSHVGNTAAAGFGPNCIRATYARLPGAGMWAGGVNPQTVARLDWWNGSSIDGAGQAATGLYVDVEGGGTNIGAYGIYVTNNAGHGGRLPNFNYGIFIDNYGTNALDWSIQAGNGQVGFGGPVGVASLFGYGSSTTTVAVAGGVSASALTLTQVVKLSAPAIDIFGVPGITTYSYLVVYYDLNGNPTAASSAGSTTIGNATLSASNGNLVNFIGSVSSGATTFAVYRTVGGSTQGKIATGSLVPQNYSTYFESLVYDTGLVADGTTAPTVNSTGSIVAAGPISAGQFTVSGLPAGVEGQTAYATNGLKTGESTGYGTGVPVYYSAHGPAGAGWYIFSAATHVAS